MDLKRLDKILAGEKPYRLKQVHRAIFKDLITDWDDATNLSLKLRGMLKEELPLSIDSRIIKSKESDAVKAVIRISGGVLIETVLMQHSAGRNTVCVSSQAGCTLGCLFCQTGKLGFKRDLDSSEIIVQVLLFQRFLKNRGSSISNIVFMGMGEPFLNYDNVLEAVRIINSNEMFDIGARHISISTAGLPDKIKLFAGEGIQVNLAVSLNAPNDVLRSKIMPVNLRYKIPELLESIRYYIGRTNRKVMFEYVMIEDLNDSEENARELADLLKGLLCMVNLIPFNGEPPLKPPAESVITAFKKILEENGIIVTRRSRFGADIDSACGQLVFDEERNGNRQDQ
ncbi:MAG: 23S rRNA (adenine(2503)-C(2))-methyltransferase RlmN [Actinomycetia bacterium]|nr:23S rRNA (adenine(2503)-C(2))-methyltransferase RlmN [Actinomycetes bacterium]